MASVGYVFARFRLRIFFYYRAHIPKEPAQRFLTKRIPSQLALNDVGGVRVCTCQTTYLRYAQHVLDLRYVFARV